jgi:hypothetical protein
MKNSQPLNEAKLRFIRVTMVYKTIILNWFEEAHVKEFYHGKGLKNFLHNLDLYCQGINDNGRYSFDLWMAFCDEIPLILSPTL